MYFASTHGYVTSNCNKMLHVVLLRSTALTANIVSQGALPDRPTFLAGKKTDRIVDRKGSSLLPTAPHPGFRADQNHESF